MRGDIVLPAGAPAFDGACAWVRLEEVSRLDAAAAVLGEVRLVGLRRPRALVDRAPSRFAFAVQVPGPLAPRGVYALRARIEGGGLPAGAPLDSTERTPVRPETMAHRHEVLIFAPPRRAP